MSDVATVAPAVKPRQTQPIVLKRLGPGGQQQAVPRHAKLHPLRIIRDVSLAVFIPTTIMVAFGLFQAMFPQRIITTETPANYGLAFEDVRLTTSDGLNLAAWYVPSQDNASKSAIVVLHGYPASKGDLIARVQFLAAKHALLLVDFRYFGGSEGSYTTFGIRENADALAAIDYLKSRGAEKIGIYGFSMGGAVALTAATRSEDVAAVVAEAPYASLSYMAEEPYILLGPLKRPLGWLLNQAATAVTGTDLEKASPLAAAATSRKPTLLIHSRADEVMPFRNAEALWSAMSANPAARSLFFEDQEHGAASDEFARTVDEFFDANLKP